MHDTAFGKAIGKVFEWFYERKIWMESDVPSALQATIEPAVRAIFVEERTNTESERDLYLHIIDQLKDYVPRFLEVIRKYKLLTESSSSEVDLTTVYTSPKHQMTLKIGGRADFIHRPGSSVWILDGKAGSHRERYVDSEQLVWYAVQHYLKYKIVPSRLGFLYYRFPNDPIQWISYDSRVLEESVDVTFDVAKKISLKMFEARPNNECSRCDYQGKCEEGMRHVASKKMESGSRIENSIFDLEGT